jgi:outer membrane protein
MSADEAVKATILGSPLTGADLEVAPRYAAEVEIGRYIVPTLAFSVSAGTPVRQSIVAAGSIRPLGTLGRVTYGLPPYHALAPAAAVAHPPVRRRRRRLSPCLQRGRRPGGGVRLRDDLGPVVQGGAEIMAGRRFGVYADAKRAWLTSSGSGSLGDLPVNGRVRLDPLVLSAGAAFRF